MVSSETNLKWKHTMLICTGFMLIWLGGIGAAAIAG